MHVLAAAFGMWGDTRITFADPFLDTAYVIKVATACLKIQHPVGCPFIICIEGADDEIVNRQYDAPQKHRPEQPPVARRQEF